MVFSGPGAGCGGVDFEAELLPRIGAPLAEVAGAPKVPVLHAALPGVLAVDWIPGATLYARRRGGEDDDDDERIGGAFAVLHAVSRREAWLPERLVLGDLGERIVWTSPEQYAALGPAALELWRRVQADDLATRTLIELVEQETRETACFVHGDARQANIVLTRRVVAFVDWELAGWGDPARDPGMLFADDLAAFLAPRVGREAMRLSTLRRRGGALVRGYRSVALREAMDPGPRFDERVIAWAGEALLRRVHTIAHHEGRFDRVEAHLTASALELLRHPKRWAQHFLGKASAA